ncbi:uncharacterized protein B0H18DRAFT_1118154 [Fomitopsis serialis]|uniref:uncharacterized protein n=1 Tax=Fomitopsis serialis TaxID=139415 RepID=UPI00200817C1|nr:uncharacterized protein B0H18DRAFT_1118154 [Neoantrodia serialis]KAH9928135.1 hypothetical protein B0H18DRAFT_1118154 [Neoantrodia serialis]
MVLVIFSHYVVAHVAFSIEESLDNIFPAPLDFNENQPFDPENAEENDEGATGAAVIERQGDDDVRNLLDSERRRSRKGKQPERRDVLQRWPAERRSQAESKSPDMSFEGNAQGSRHGNGIIREPEPGPSSRSPDAEPSMIHMKRKIRKAKLDYTWHANAGPTPIAKPPSTLDADDLGTLFLHRILSANGKVTDAVQVWMWDQFDDGSTGWRSINESNLPHHPMSPELTLSFTPTGDPSWIVSGRLDIMIGSSNHVVSSSIVTKMKEANMAMAKVMREEEEEGDHAADEDVDELEESDVDGPERAEERRQVNIKFHGDYRCDYCKRAEEWAQKRAAKVVKGPSEITPFICTISGRRKRCDFCSKGRRTPCSLQPYLINNLISVDKDLVGTYTINHAPEATVTGIESNNKIYSAVRVQDSLPRTKRMTSPAKPKRKNAVKAAKRVARARSSASLPRKRAQPIATSVTGSSSHSNNSQSHVETDLLNQEGSRLRSTAEEALDGLCSDVRRLESEMYELRNTLEAERAFRKEVAVDLAKLRSEMDDLRAGAGARSLAALELDISAFVAKVRRQLGSVDDRGDRGTTHQAAGMSSEPGEGNDGHGATPVAGPSCYMRRRSSAQRSPPPPPLHHPAAAAAPSQPRRRCSSEASPEQRDPPAGGLKHGGLARVDVRQVDMGVDMKCRRDESLRNVGRISLLSVDLRLSPMAGSPSPETDPQVQGDDLLRFMPSTVDGIVKATETKGGELQVAQPVGRYRRRATPGCEEEQAPYHVLAAPDALAKTLLAAKISELQPPPILGMQCRRSFRGANARTEATSLQSCRRDK